MPVYSAKTHKLAYDWLADIAAETTEPVTYGHLAATLSHLRGAPGPARRHLASILWAVHNLCVDNDEPDLTSMVVARHGKVPASGYMGPEPERERERCHRYHDARKFGGPAVA